MPQEPLTAEHTGRLESARARYGELTPEQKQAVDRLSERAGLGPAEGVRPPSFREFFTENVPRSAGQLLTPLIHPIETLKAGPLREFS